MLATYGAMGLSCVAGKKVRGINLKYLTAYLRICNNHINYDCGGCPFNMTSISEDCHDWIIKHPEESSEIIKAYVQRFKDAKQTKEGEPRKHVLICKNCGRVETYSERDFEWDSYINSNVFVCQNCKRVQEVPRSVGASEQDAEM